MIFCSDLPNDQDMIHALGSTVVPLPSLFTDALFSTCDNKLVACERKKIGDLCQCINDGRFLQQMIVCREYQVEHLILILEGRYRRNPDDGLLEVPVWSINPRTMRRAEIWQPVRPAMMFSRFDQYLTELARDVGIIIKHTEDVRGTADVIQALYTNFQTPQSGHQSLKSIYKPPMPAVALVRPSLVRRIACELDGIGWEWSKIVADRFRSVREMLSADVTDWAELERVSENGKKRRLGKKTAEKVVKALH